MCGHRLSLGTDVKGACLYMISSTTAIQGHWVICLHSPTTLLQIYRNCWTTLDTIVRELVSRGIQFNTAVPDPSPSPSLKVVERGYESKGLGLRPASYIPHPHDYNAYVSARTDVLHSPLSCAVLLRGGLVARLARDTVGVPEVLSGPEPTTSMMLWAVDGVRLVNDQLSNYLLDIISGIYYVETAMDAQIHQHLSWWPKDGIWFSSGFYTKQWSADAKRWYKSHLKEIEGGSARLYNSTEWKSKLRQFRTKTRALLSVHHRLSESVVDQHLS